MTERRVFLKRFVKTSFSLAALAFLGSLAYLYPSHPRKRETVFVPVMDEDDLPRRGVKRVNYHYATGDRTVASRVYLVAAESGPMALSPTCTHLGCFVAWDGRRGEFVCPCHGGRFATGGDVLKGPPSKPLVRIPLRISDGKVYLGVEV